MTSTPPLIQGNVLTYQQSGQPTHLLVDTPDWYAWLRSASTFTFHSEQGTFTARKERAGSGRGGEYWKAYRRRHGKLSRAYLGKSEELTLEQLKAVAGVLASKGEGDGSLDVPGLGGGTGPSSEASSMVSADLQRAKGELSPHEASISKPWLSSLPVPPTALIGRQQEMRAVCDLLAHPEVRLLTITGTGGAGKTRLALEVARVLRSDFTDGSCFVPLAPISDPALVMPTIAQAFDLQEAGQQPMLGLLQAFLRDKQLLLVLDNFEQVLDAASQVADLLAACPRLKVLVTSRFVLHVRGEQEFAVPPLAVPDPKHLPDLARLSQYEAVALFIARAQAVKPDFQVTHANAPAVVEICARLDGLPLAIELAAARSKLLPPRALLARLEKPLVVLTSGSRDMPARQQTLRNTIAWSYQLLDAQEQRLFRQLSVFVGGCTLEAIEAVCMTLGGEAGSLLDVIASLIDKSLLQQTEQEGGEPRLAMLETIREYGLECLAASGEVEATRHAHAAYYLQLAEVAPYMFGAGEQTWIDRLEREHDNLRGAMNWLLEHRETRESIEMSLRLAAALWWFWVIRGHRHEGWTFLEQALVGSESVTEPARAKALWAAGNLAGWLGHFARAEALCQESLALAQQIGDAEGMRNAVFHLGFVADAKRDFAAARPLFERSVVLSREAGDKFLLAHALVFLAFEALSQGEYARARLLIEEGLAAFKELGHKTGIMFSLRGLACVTFFQGDLASAHTLGEECLTRQKEFGGKQAEAALLAFLGNVALHQGDILTARSLLEKSCVVLREVRDEEHQLAWTLSLFGKVHAVQGDYTTARACYEESLQSLVHVQAPNSNMSFLDLASVLEGLAAVVAAQGGLAWAVRLWSAAEALRETRSMPLPPLYRADYERAVAAARTQLGEKTFAALWSEGRSLTPEQALATRGPATMSCPSAPSGKSPVTYPDRLTAREVEVLRLVAQGLSDAQIADKLVISPGTVNTHLKSIYGKTQVSSRSAATRYAIEHHLQ
jgi:predicted ATPase/DNA-binding CsgD family transcriptional regulator